MKNQELECVDNSYSLETDLEKNDSLKYDIIEPQTCEVLGGNSNSLLSSRPKVT